MPGQATSTATNPPSPMTYSVAVNENREIHLEHIGLSLLAPRWMGGRAGHATECTPLTPSV